MLPISFRRLLTILVLSMLAVGGSQTAYAQSNNNTANTVGGIVGLFAGIAQAGAKADAQKKWMQVAEPVRACVNVAYSSKGVTLDQIYNEGIAPSDQRIAPVMNFCNATMTRQLRQNFACNVQNSKGQQVTSICSEGFARPVNGSLTAASTEDYITAAMNGEKVQIAAIETGAGRTARERAERDQQEELARKAEAERQAFLNSPEGKRQAAAQIAAEKQIAVAHAKIAKNSPLMKSEFERLAPPLNQAMQVHFFLNQTQKPKIKLIHTCRLTKRIDFDENNIKIIGTEVPVKMANFAYAEGLDGLSGEPNDYVGFQDQTAIGAKNKGTTLSAIKGFPASLKFSSHDIYTYNNQNSNVGLFNIQIAYEDDKNFNQIKRIGKAEVVVVMIKGEIISRLISNAKLSDVYDKPNHLIARTNSYNEEIYYAGACTQTYISNN